MNDGISHDGSSHDGKEVEPGSKLTPLSIFINMQNVKKETALHIACKRGKKDLVKLLLSEGADATLKAEDASTALSIACGLEISSKE